MLDEKKAAAIVKIIELAEEIGWQSLAITSDPETLAPDGVLIGSTDFIEGFKKEMESSINDTTLESLLDVGITGDDDDDDSGKTFH